MFGKQKFKAVFFIKEHDTFRIRKKKRFNPLKPVIYYKGKPYCPIIAEPTYLKGIFSYYFFEIDGKQITILLDGKKEQVGKQLETKINDNDVESNAKDLLYSKEVIKQVFMSLEKRSTTINWIHLVLAGALFFLAGWILGSYIPIGVFGSG